MYASMSKRWGMVALICMVIGVGGDGVINQDVDAQPTPFWQEGQSGPVPSVSVPAPNFTELAERLQPAVVNISTTQVIQGLPRGSRDIPAPGPFGERSERHRLEEFFERFFGGNRPQREMRRSSLGSGFIVTKDGHIVTNNHVVENATDIKVSLSDKEEFDAKVIGRDPKTEVALIKIDAARDLPVVPLGDSDQLRVGEWVIAIGNPFGLGHTLTTGIASAKGRVIGASAFDDFIQTDASINPGNSGGPLFNLNGQVIGINTAIVATGQGIGFAIPINLAKEVLIQLREQGRVTRGWLGVQVQQLTPELAQSFGVEQSRGALVADVQPNSPAARAGVQRGDVITTFNGRTIEAIQDLPRVVATTPPNTTVDVRLLRQGRERTVQVRIGEMPEEEQQASVGGAPLGGEFGLVVHELTPDMAHTLELPDTQGVVVTDIEDGSLADEVGLRRGDVILEVNQQKITNVHDYQTALDHTGAAKSTLFLIRRGESTVYVALRPEK